MREKRWVGFSWPREVGGGGGTIMQQVILKEEMAKRKAPPLGSCFMGLAWVGPSIVQYGSEAQKQRFIPDILDGKYQWCTGYSEPDSGSDLTSLQCKAVRDGDHYVVTGQKIWTSIAMWSKWMILLVRTDASSESKHDGITCLLVEMSTPGIEVRPIQNMSGTAGHDPDLSTEILRTVHDEHPFRLIGYEIVYRQAASPRRGPAGRPASGSTILSGTLPLMNLQPAPGMANTRSSFSLNLA